MTEKPNRILLIQLKRLGDVVLTTPALSALKMTYPEAQIDFLVEGPGAQALKNHPAITNIITYDSNNLLSDLRWAFKLRNNSYEWVIDFLATPRTALITLLSGAKLKAGPGHVKRRWVYNHWMKQSPETCYSALEKIRWLSSLGVNENKSSAIPQLFLCNRTYAIDNVIGLAPASRQQTRRWPAKSYVELGRLMRDKFACQIKVFWGPGEKALAEQIANDIGEMASPTTRTETIGDLSQELVKLKMLISNCSGTKHVAVALGVPTLTIHSSSDPKAWTPSHPDHTYVRLEELHCIGCRSNHCRFHLECLKDLSPQRVFEHAQQFLSRINQHQ